MNDICVATHQASIKELLDDAEFAGLANRAGFLVELRLDFFADLSIESFDLALNRFAPRAVVTFRHPAEGGRRPGVSDAERLSYLQRAADRGVEYIDIEARTALGAFNKRAAKLILSHHDFHRAPSLAELRELWQRIAAQPAADVVKIAVMPATVLDTAPVLQLLTELHGNSGGPRPLLLCMEEAGLWSRVLAGRFGAPLTYARGAGAPGTAPGQLTWRALSDTYRYHDIRSDWPVYGVLGNPVGHSLSPLMHNTALRTLGLPGVYLPFKVDGDPAEFLRSFGALLSGCSVTIPHKETVMAACAEVDAGAAAIGAVNTLNRTPAGWSGSNTDAPAAADCLEDALGSLSGKRVLVIGAGGAARAVVCGVQARGADAFVLNRTRERAEALGRETGATVVDAAALPGLSFDAVVNTTPLGMHPKIAATPLEESQFPKCGLIFDTVYNPRRTRLLKLAEARGCRTIEGVSMFIAQGVRQFELWTGRTAPRDAMTQVVLAALG